MSKTKQPSDTAPDDAGMTNSAAVGVGYSPPGTDPEPPPPPPAPEPEPVTTDDE